MEKYCDDCEKIVELTEDGYCIVCGKHSDNMLYVEDIISKIISDEIIKKLRNEPTDLV